MATGEVKTLVFADGVDVTAPQASPVGAAFDVVVDGSTLTYSVDVSASVPDARLAAWVLKKPSGSNFEQVIGVKITTPDAATVALATDIALDAGTYRLVGVY